MAPSEPKKEKKERTLTGLHVRKNLRRMASGGSFLLEVKFKAGANLVKITVKAPTKDQSEIVKGAVAKILSA